MKIWNARRETKNVVPPLRQLFIHSLSILIFHDSHQKETKRKHRTEWVERPAAPNYSIVSWLWSCLQFRAACVGNRSCCHHMSRSLSFVVYYPSAFSHRKSDGSTFDLHFIWWWLHGAATPHLVCLALHIEWNGNPFDIDSVDSFILVGNSTVMCWIALSIRWAQSLATHTVVVRYALLFICIITYFIVECVLLFRWTRAPHARKPDKRWYVPMMIDMIPSQRPTSRPTETGCPQSNGDKVIHFRVKCACECGLTELFCDRAGAAAIEMLHFFPNYHIDFNRPKSKQRWTRSKERRNE